MAFARATGCYGIVAIVLCLASFACAHVPLNFDRLQTALETASSRFVRSHAALQQPLPPQWAVGEAGAGRRALLQTSQNVCSWGVSQECSISSFATLNLLEAVDNPVATYVNRLVVRYPPLRISPRGLRTELWSIIQSISLRGRRLRLVRRPGVCLVPHDEFREFHSVDCLAEVDHIVEGRAGRFECLVHETETECVTSGRCNWNEDSCLFDRWYHYYGIRTDGLFPTGFPEILALVQADVSEQIQVLIQNGEITTWRDLLYWDPDPIECPAAYSQPVCDYVNSFRTFVATTFYCGLQYPSAVELLDCDSDALCDIDTGGTGSVCTANPDASLLASLEEAEKGFAAGIQDPEARIYEQQSVECQFLRSATDCGGNSDCIWRPSNEVCYVRDLWVEEEIYRLVGETEDPVCQYFVLGTTSGCAELVGETDCEANPRCFFSSTSLQCSTSINAAVEFALGVSDSADAYVELRERCEAAETSVECANVGEDAPAPASEPAPSSEAPESSLTAESSEAPESSEAAESSEAPESSESAESSEAPESNEPPAPEEEAVASDLDYDLYFDDYAITYTDTEDGVDEPSVGQTESQGTEEAGSDFQRARDFSFGGGLGVGGP